MKARVSARRLTDHLRTTYRRAAMLDPERCPFCGLSTVESVRGHLERIHPDLARNDPTARPRFSDSWG